MRLLVLLLILLQILLYMVFRHRSILYSPLLVDSAKLKQAQHDAVLQEATLYFGPTNIERLQAVAGPRNGASATGISSPKKRSIVILTTQRRRRYLHVAMWSLLLPLNNPHSQDLADTSVTILNVQRPAEKHTDVDVFRNWSTVVAVEDMYPTSANNNGMGSGTGTGTRTTSSWHVRQTEDYVAALRICSRQALPWCILLEEDSLLTHRFLAKLQQHVESSSVLSSSSSSNNGNLNIGYVKLFVTDHWKGFQIHRVHFLGTCLVSLAALVLTMLVVCFSI